MKKLFKFRGCNITLHNSFFRRRFAKGIISFFGIISFWLLNFWYCAVYDWYDTLWLNSVYSWTYDLNNWTKTFTPAVSVWYTYCLYLSFDTSIISSTSNILQLTFNPWAFSTSSYKTYNIQKADNVNSLFVCWDSPLSSTTLLHFTLTKWAAVTELFNINYNLYQLYQKNSSCSECESALLTCVDLNSSCNQTIGLLNNELTSCQSALSGCQNTSSCDYSWYILESEVTQNYCEVRYDLITPGDCPSNGWSGEVLWSSFWVNERQIMWWKNIYLYLPDFLDWSYTYVDENLQVDVENEWDAEYIQSIIDINSYRPSSSDFTDTFISWLTLVFPYIVIVLFIVFIRKMIKRIFK